MKQSSNKNHSQQSIENVKSYQEKNDEIFENDTLKNRQPTPQPKEYDEIEY
ncbi:hypothetical protein [Neobacillus sp. D3-1R]|uniref:hypothetical protein n=1 Tax=Neobacillus sp. D3-1R TaxID=3445778 RepID=UPI003FA0E2D4